MKRYNFAKLKGNLMWDEIPEDAKDHQGIWIKYADHEAEIKNLQSEIEDYQAMFMDIENKNHRLKEQNKEMFQCLKDISRRTAATWITDFAELTIEKIEKENSNDNT